MGSCVSKMTSDADNVPPTFSVPRASSSQKVVPKLDDDYQDPPPYTPVNRSESLSISDMKQWEDVLLSDPKNRLAMSSISKNAYPKIITNQSAARSDKQVFNIKIPLEGNPITNQRSSGRCWLFASTNVFRVPLMKKYNVSDFELSQSYLFYWDKIEKANYFLEQIIQTANEGLSSRLVQTLLNDPVSDGGQWDMLSNLVNKYGLVPHALYPDSFNAESSGNMNWLITAKLREQALLLRQLARSSSGKDRDLLASKKNSFVQEIHGLVTIALGAPPSPEKEFVWEYYDSKGKFQQLSISPKAFAADALTAQARGDVDPKRMISLVNDPRNEYHRLLTVEKLGNITEGRPITYVNVDMETMKTTAISMLKSGHPVFFGCDVGKFYDGALGVMDTELLDLNLGFNVSLGMTKAERIETGESSMTHAMVLTGVHVENGRPVRWRVQNSWGDKAGYKGWFVMADRWMDEYTYQVVVDDRFVSREVRDVLGQQPKVLPRWDPMGVLA